MTRAANRRDDTRSTFALPKQEVECHTWTGVSVCRITLSMTASGYWALLQTETYVLSLVLNQTHTQQLWNFVNQVLKMAMNNNNKYIKQILIITIEQA